MVTIDPRKAASNQRRPSITLPAFIAISVLIVTWMSLQECEESSQHYVTPPTTRSISDSRNLEELQEGLAQHNAAMMREWRGRATVNSSEALVVSKLQKCSHVFLDLGSNVGDALHKFIDSFMPTFEDGNGKKLRYIFNTTTGRLGPEKYQGIGTLLPDWIKKKMHTYNNNRGQSSRLVHPEDYCFYGVEGNPFFTRTLQEMEISLLNMKPRPVRHLHFLVEHVAAATNGPTTLYLDTVNEKQHYWGSSILKSHADVKRSGGKTGVQVMAITLTSLLEQTVLQNEGGHVMIKIDIEGAEYQLLEEAVNSNIFCRLVNEKDITVDIINEFHGDSIVGSPEPRHRWETIVKGEEAIKGCSANYEVVKSLIPTW
jgi:hypothetical protein